MADNMGVVGGGTLQEKCGPVVGELKMKFLDYIVGLHRAVSPDKFSEVPSTLEVRPELNMKCDDNGFPLMPAQGTMRKQDLELLVRTYLNTHYCERCMDHQWDVG